MTIDSVRALLLVPESPVPLLIFIRNIGGLNDVIRVSSNREKIEMSTVANREGIQLGQLDTLTLQFCNGPVYVIADNNNVIINFESWPQHLFQEKMITELIR